MGTPKIPPWLIRVVVAVAIPTMACFGYYSLERLGEGLEGWAVPVVLAYPAALIGLVGFVMAWNSPRRSIPKLALCALCIVVPILFLLWVRS